MRFGQTLRKLFKIPLQTIELVHLNEQFLKQNKIFKIFK